MLSVLLMILKVLGMILLILLGTILLLILLVLFVPVRYQIMLHRKVGEETPVTAKVKATWLLHALNAAFSYPEAAFLRVRIFCFTIFRSDKPKKTIQKDNTKKETVQKENVQKEEIQKETVKTVRKDEEKKADGQKNAEIKVSDENQKEKNSYIEENAPKKQEKEPKQSRKINKFFEFFRKLFIISALSFSGFYAYSIVFNS